ncbi:hypothetical protein CCYA_CCYA03G1015 [Cyanidiococcus yangmingshanensis]|nr:hypothetical protein CCYA_CCYA03G1015 [Cyanidiococcus yangmingshanensis]
MSAFVLPLQNLCSLEREDGRNSLGNRQKRGYWKDVVAVARQIAQFQTRLGLPSERLPTEYELRRYGYEGGHTILRAFRLHGGKQAFLKKLALVERTGADPEFARWQPNANGKKLTSAAKAANLLRSQLEELARRLDLPEKSLPSLQLLRKHEPLLANIICSTPGGYAAIARELNCCIEPRRPSRDTKPSATEPLELDELRQQLLAFIAEKTVTPGVMPPLRVLAKAERLDLVASIEHHGGSRVVAERFGLRDYASWEYVLELRDLVRELSAYMRVANKGNEMPSLAELQRQGRPDLARLVRRHGGPLVVAARFGLDVPPLRRRRDMDIKWGPFSLEVAERLLDACFVRGRAVDGVPEMPPLTELETDLQNKIEEYGGPDLVARRLGLAFAP